MKALSDYSKALYKSVHELICRYSSAGVARRTKLCAATISKLANRKLPNPSLETLAKLAAGFEDQSIGSLLGEASYDLSSLSVDKETKELLEQVIRKARKQDVLKKILRTLSSTLDLTTRGSRTRSFRTPTPRDEMAVLSSGISILRAYVKGDWEGLRRFADELEKHALELCRPHLALLARGYRAKALRELSTRPNQGHLLEEAKHLLKRSKEARQPWYYRVLGQVVESQGDFREALRNYERAERMFEAEEGNKHSGPLADLERAKLYRNLAELHMKFLRRSGNVRSRSSHVREATKYFRLAFSYIDQALQFHDVEARHERAICESHKAEFEIDQGEHLRARKRLEKLLEELPPYGRTYSKARNLLLMAWACLDAGQKEEALASLHSALGAGAAEYGSLRRMYWEHVHERLLPAEARQFSGFGLRPDGGQPVPP